MEESKKTEIEQKTCKYLPTRANQEECRDPPFHEWGYCKRHGRTVQSQKAKREWESKKEEEKEEQLQKKQETQKEEIKEPEQQRKKKTKVVKKNSWGNFEDSETHIIFDPYKKCAYGVQDPSGKILSLGKREIKICEENGWKYMLDEEEENESEESEDESEEDDESEESEDEEEEEDESEESDGEEEEDESDEEEEGESDEEEEEEDESEEDSY